MYTSASIGWPDDELLLYVALQALPVQLHEYIPFNKVKGVIAACREAGLSAFPWVNDFYREIDAFNDDMVHHLSEYEQRYGREYLTKIPSRYWIHLGGRALKTFQDVFETRKCETILSANPCGCAELVDTSHFHLDV